MTVDDPSAPLKAALKREANILRDVTTAREAFDQISPEMHYAVREATFTGAVTVYARGFLDGRGSQPYKIRDLKKASGFDREIHTHLIEARNRLVAHLDSEVSNSEILAVNQPVEIDGVLWQTTLGLFTLAHGFLGFKSPDFLDRIRKHLRASEAALLVSWVQAASALMDYFSTEKFMLAEGAKLDPEGQWHSLDEINNAPPNPIAVDSVVDRAPGISFSEHYGMYSLRRELWASSIRLRNGKGEPVVTQLSNQAIVDG